MLTEAEIKTLPLTSRNPYNFAVFQPGVTGFGNAEFGVPRITANGALVRVNYQIDGSNNTQKDRVGLRQMPMSEVMIREVKIVTTGYAPEFGQTMGMIYNAITPSGTNTLKGQGSYRLQRRPYAAFPFFTQGPHTSDRKPPTDVNIITFDLGGPVLRDKTHFFGGYEHTERDLSGTRVITITPANQAALGLTEPTYMPTALNTEFAIGKLDHQLNQNNRLSARYIFFDNFINDNIGGGLTSVQRGTDFTDRQHSTGVQLISTVTPTLLNELRVQYATRAQGRVPGARGGTGPAINITNVANFGGPIAGDADAGFRVHAGRVPGGQQPDPHPRRPRLQVRHRYPARRRQPYAHGVAGLHLPERRRVSGGGQRHQSLRLHDLRAVLRRAQPRIQLEHLRLLRAGRLAAVVRHQGSLRSPLRPLRRAGRQRRCAVRGLA